MNINDIDTDKLDKFSIKALEGYLDSNPELSTIKLVQLLSESILHLKKYIENPKEKDITWDNPAIQLKYAVEYSDNELELPFIFYEEDTQEKNIEELILNRLFNDYPLSVLLREMSDYITVFKQGDKIEARISPQNEHLKKLTGAKRERYLSELGEKYLSDNKKPTLTLPFKLDFSDDKEPKRRRKTSKGNIIFDVSPLFVDLDSGEVNYTVIAGLDIEGYKPIDWSKEEKKEFWEELDKAFKTYAPQESFDFLEKLIEIEPEVKPIIKDKGYVYKHPKGLANIEKQIYISGRGLTKKDFIKSGEQSIEWALIGGVALYPKEKQDKIDRKKNNNQRDLDLIPDPPKLGVSQAKNMIALGYMSQIENWRREKAGKPKKAELEFALKDYAKTRGKSDTQIAKGGSVIDELKRDLFSGAYTTYRLDKVEIDGKIYIAHGIPNFYTLYEPVNKKNKWRIVYNELYRNYFINKVQYAPVLIQAMQDTDTDNEKGFRLFFVNRVMEYPNFRTPLKVSTLLNNINAGDRIKDRPKEAFKVLCDCIYYTTKFKTPTVLKEVKFFDSGKYENFKLITDLEKFKDWKYDNFKNEILNALGLTDIREALISFSNTSQKELPEEPGEIKQIGEYKATLKL